jgi:hypothetical protein
MVSGGYRDYGEAISAAIHNLLLMEQEVDKTGSILIGGEKRTSGLKIARPAQHNGEKKTQEQKKPSRTHAARADVAAQPTVPDIFRREGLPADPPATLADLPPDTSLQGQVISLDRWVLGQFNRLLPAKANARAIVHLFLDSLCGLDVAEAARTISNQAAALGEYLRWLDTQSGASRDQALATAFPATGDEGENSRARYGNQFVAYKNSKGELSGQMVDFKLVRMVQHGRERRIVPTRVAWGLALLRNPVLDQLPDNNVEKFTLEERAFILNHILQSVPAEAFAYRVLLKAVQEGQNTPQKLDALLQNEELWWRKREPGVTLSFLCSQRSGAISRMTDLGLVQRRWEGVRVYYSVTDEGLSFLQQCPRT